MKIAIFGSTGFVGKVLIKKAIAAGYQVKTLARNPEKLKEIKDKIEIILRLTQIITHASANQQDSPSLPSMTDNLQQQLQLIGSQIEQLVQL